MVTDFSVCARMMQIGLYLKKLTSASLLFLKGISSTMSFKERSLVFFSVVAIQIVVKTSKENASESLILFSETGWLIFKQLLFSCLFRIPYTIDYASLPASNRPEADCYVFRTSKY